MECVELAPAVQRRGTAKAGASSTHSIRFARFGCGIAKRWSSAGNSPRRKQEARCGRKYLIQPMPRQQLPEHSMWTLKVYECTQIRPFAQAARCCWLHRLRGGCERSSTAD